MMLQNGKISLFLWLSNIPLYICAITFLSTRLLMGTWVASIYQLLSITPQRTEGCFHFFELVFWVSSYTDPEVRSLGHKAAQFLFFWWNFILFSIAAAPICISTNSARGCLFLHVLANTYVFWFTDASHSDRSDAFVSFTKELQLQELKQGVSAQT